MHLTVGAASKGRHATGIDSGIKHQIFFSLSHAIVTSVEPRSRDVPHAHAVDPKVCVVSLSKWETDNVQRKLCLGRNFKAGVSLVQKATGARSEYYSDWGSQATKRLDFILDRLKLPGTESQVGHSSGEDGDPRDPSSKSAAMIALSRCTRSIRTERQRCHWNSVSRSG